MENRTNNDSGIVIWVTGLPGSGKTTLAKSAADKLNSMGIHAVVLDGDEMRQGLCSDLGFSMPDRSENVRRVGEVAKLFKNAGLATLVALISPVRNDRRQVRALFKPNEFIEIWCRCPLSICEKRDGENLYNRARLDEIPNFTGITSTYENPESPELVIDTDQLSVEEVLTTLFAYLKYQGYLDNL
jgi:adenylylsulfate kinase